MDKLSVERILEDVSGARSPRAGGVRVFANPRVDHVAADRAARHQLPAAGLVRAARTIAGWSGYAPTPLVCLGHLAAQCGITELWVKDEGPRFGLGSFKALGGAYAVASAARTVAAAPTVVSATDGNHGRSVAWGARRAGCRCVIYLHETVSAEREQAIRALGANIVRTPGNYDDAARACAKDARRMGWVVVSDTAGQGEDERNMALTVMQGYGVMVDELTEQLAAEWPTHVFIQGGCGGLAAAVRAHLATLRGARPQPHFVVVEPAAAACLYLSAVAGEIQTVPGALETVMAGLAVGEPSVPAWEILAIGADAFVTISDEMAVTAMRALADPHGDDAPVVAGETGAAALGALIAVGDDPEARTALGLHSSSRVLLINTESDTDPQIYAGIVGRSAAAVRYGKPRTKETSN